MSGSYTNMSSQDDGTYDPSRHDNQLVAVYDGRTDAEAARSALLAAGIPSSAVGIVDNTSAGAGRLEERSAVAADDEGFWGTIKNLFAPDDDYQNYHHAIGRGHVMVVVTSTAQMDRKRIIETLEAHNPIDVDSKADEWRQTGFGSTTASPAMAPGMAESRASFGAKSAATTNQSAADLPVAGTQAGLSGKTGQDIAGNRDTIEVAQERLRVGKREVAQGAVRVRSYVVERPVEEEVRLHEERVEVERRPVDRAVTPGDAGLFQERTIEARATSEEAVVSKEARVVEEIALKKEALDRTETVRDTVRETKVDIDDERAKNATPNTTGSRLGAGGSTATAPGNKGGNPPRRP